MTKRIAAVIGWPIEHSKSPAMMNAAFAATGLEAEMIRVGVPPEQFTAKLAALRSLPMLGASITIPHKLSAHDRCDELTPAAREIGAVNCLELRNGKLIGHNTDAPGFVDAAIAAGVTLSGAHVVLLGAGGASRAVAYGCREAGARVDVAARTPNPASTHPWSELSSLFTTADLVVDCTSAGLDRSRDLELALTLPLGVLRPEARVTTLVYSTSRARPGEAAAPKGGAVLQTTNLLERAAQRGHSTFDGTAMLVHQGARAFTIWTGLPAPIDVMTAAL